MIDTDLHIFLPSLDTPCFPLPGMSQTPVNRLYSCGFNSRVIPYTHGFSHESALS